MEELSPKEYARLSISEQKEYIRRLLGENSCSDTENFSDSDDDDWMPERANRDECSDNENEEEIIEDADNIDPDESENSEEEDNVNADYDIKPLISGPDHFQASDGTIWNKNPPLHYQTLSYKNIRQRSGPHRSTETLSICNTFKCILTNEIINVIVCHTNKKAKKVYEEYNKKNPMKKPLHWKDLTLSELYAFIGVLITSGANHSNTDHVFDLFKSNSYPLYRAAMGLNRFCNIVRFLRFDDANTREQRLQEDKVAPISEIWTMLNSKLFDMYRPTENLIIDEQLFGYRGRTCFTQYIPSKPTKYGIKVWWICDAENYYPLTGQIYTGTSGREINQGERVVKELVAPFSDSWRNITTDNFLTTLPLAEHLLSWKLTLVGTLKKNKKYIPAEMREVKNREINSSLFGFHGNTTICSYVPKKNKAVIFLSSMHHDNATSGLKNKPDIIHFYDKTKSGVDVIDKLLSKYTVRRRTNRWSLAFFYNIIDIAAFAAYIIYYQNNDMIQTKTDRRRVFLRQLGEELSQPVIEDRSLNHQVTKDLSTKLAIESILHCSISTTSIPIPTISMSSQAERDATGRKIVVGCCNICYAAPHKRRRKTRKSCFKCKKPVCDEHSATLTICKNCPIPNN